MTSDFHLTFALRYKTYLLMSPTMDLSTFFLIIQPVMDAQIPVRTQLHKKKHN
jgi:hypothetical protein